MVTLLMTFFVLLYSFSLVDLKKFQAKRESMASQFGGGALSGGQSVIDGSNGTKIVNLGASGGGGAQVQATQKAVDKYLKKEGLSGTATAIAQERGVVIRFQDQVFFESGSAQLRTDALTIADKVAELVKELPNHVRIEGHADNVPISNSEYESNWELSTARATRFLKYMTDQGVSPSRISAAGYGEFRPIAENDSESGRRKNRRVDVVLLRTDLSEAEPRSAITPETR
jgi:chemotaxis protein MotB